MPDELMVTNSGKSFEPVSEGMHAAVLGAIVDKGKIETPWGEKPQVMLVFLTDELDEEDKPKLVFASYTRSLNEKARLYKTVATLTQSTPPESMNIMTLLGTQTTLVIQQKVSKLGRPYANIVSFLKPGKTKVEVPAGWEYKPKVKTDGPITNEDVPF